MLKLLETGSSQIVCDKLTILYHEQWRRANFSFPEQPVAMDFPVSSLETKELLWKLSKKKMDWVTTITNGVLDLGLKFGYDKKNDEVAMSYRDVESESRLGWDSLSSGTLQSIAFFSRFIIPEKKVLYLIRPEVGIHPLSVCAMGNVVYNLSQSMQSLGLGQIIIETYSPFFIEGLYEAANKNQLKKVDKNTIFHIFHDELNIFNTVRMMEDGKFDKVPFNTNSSLNHYWK